MNKHIRLCIHICNGVGLVVKKVRHRGKHIGLLTEVGELIAPCTPSDYRWRLNLRSQARRYVRHAKAA